MKIETLGTAIAIAAAAMLLASTAPAPVAEAAKKVNMIWVLAR